MSEERSYSKAVAGCKIAQPTLAEQMQPYIDRGEVIYVPLTNTYTMVSKEQEFPTCGKCGQPMTVQQFCAPCFGYPSFNINLRQAVDILNKRKHRGIDNWRVENSNGIVSCIDGGKFNFWPEEVFAIAERYLRQAE